MTTTDWYERLAALELVVDDHQLERRSLEVSSGFERVTTTVVMRGAGHEGRGEDVTYDAEDHEPDVFTRLGMGWAGHLGGLLERLDYLSLFARPPQRPASLDYRRWAFESAALDLALRQAGLPLGKVLGRAYRPVRFVVSTRLDIGALLAIYPALEFKLDPTPEWDKRRTTAIAAAGRVRVLDLKAYYTGTPVDVEPDPARYRMWARAFPEAVIEDPALDPACRRALRGAEPRFSFDAPIHSWSDVEALPVAPRFLNIKPSRFGSLRRLLECIARAQEAGITLYGGGQFELGVGRDQIQALASLFYPEGPNDVAPGGYNAGEPRPGLPASPLRPRRSQFGFGFAAL